VRTYVGTLDDGIGDADFLDALIPVADAQRMGTLHPQAPKGADPEIRRFESFRAHCGAPPKAVRA
jgi:hypothetical protein